MNSKIIDGVVWTYKRITLDQMMGYIEKNAPTDKQWFVAAAIDGNGKYQHLAAKKAFCAKYMPELIPTKKAAAPKKSEKLLNW